MMTKLLNLFKRKSTLQTFTYYIPSPPERRTGYREKEFDKIFYHFLKQGCKLVSLHTQAHQSPTHSGIWVIVVVRSSSNQAPDFDFDISSGSAGNTHVAKGEAGKCASDQDFSIYQL